MGSATLPSPVVVTGSPERCSPPSLALRARLEKREAWAQRKGTNKYVDGMGWYARGRDEATLRELLGQGPGRSLDFPCGSGRFLDLQRLSGYSIVAADYSPTMLAQTANLTRGNLARADIFHPPFKPQSFDLILISRLMFHYPDPVEILQSLLPLLKNHGRIVFDTLNTGSLRWLASIVLKTRQARFATRLYFENPRSLTERLKGLGLHVDQCRSCYVLPTRAYRFLPSCLVWLIHGLEKLCPRRFRVLTFWQVSMECRDHADHLFEK